MDNNPVGAILTMTLSVKLPVEKAKSMTKLLLNLGATSSQADLAGWTAFHRFVQTADEQLVDFLLDHDKLGTKTAINHLTFSQYSWSSPSSPLHAAVSQGNLSLVLKLISAGARVEMDFETWLKAAGKVSGRSKKLTTFEGNKELYNRTRLNPLISALRQTTNTELPIALLERGADPNSMTEHSYSVVRDSMCRSYMKGETVLDLVRELLSHLRAYGRTRRTKPSLPPGLDECLYTEGTYQHWVVARAVSRVKRSYRESMERYEKGRCKARARNNKASRSMVAAVKSKISGLQKLEEMLVQKGAKTFAE